MTTSKLIELGYEIRPVLPYFLDLDRSDFYLFPNLKLAGNFASNVKVITVMEDYFAGLKTYVNYDKILTNIKFFCLVVKNVHSE